MKNEYLRTGLKKEKKLEIENEEIRKANKLRYMGSISESNGKIHHIFSFLHILAILRQNLTL